MLDDDALATPDEWERLEAAFSRLAALPDAARAAELADLAADQPAVARRVSAMLDAAAEPSALDDGVGPLLATGVPGSDGAPRCGPYRLVAELGRGGMGVVYRAHRDDVDASAAVKLLLHAWLDPARRAQLLNEARMLAALSHPAIARLLDAGHLDDGTPWFAMELVEGERITEWAWRRRLEPDAILRLFDALCAAVQHAHGLPIVHRDLKPGNVLVTADGAVKLLDFGIAKRAVGSPDVSRTLTREASPAYAAPEQLLGRVAGVRADVYALGVLLYELLAGCRPYDVADLDPAAAVQAIEAAYPPRLERAWRDGAGAARDGTPADGARWIPARRLGASARRDLDALLARATAPRPDDRYASVEALRRDVDRYIRQAPLEARRAGRLYRARKFVRRRWRAIAVVGAFAATGAGALAMHTRALAASRDVAVAEAARTNRLRRYLEDLFQGGRQPVAGIESVHVATLVENGIREVRSLSTDPAMQAELLGTLGVMSHRMGNVERADSLLRLAGERAAALYGVDHPETLRARLRRANVLAARGRPDDAERELRQLAGAAAAIAPTEHPVLAELDAALGALLRERGEYAAALPYLRSAAAREEARDPLSREHADALRELGNGEFAAGDFAAADSLYRRALPLASRLFGSQHPDVGHLHANLGHIASIRGATADAERHQRAAHAIHAAWFGDEHYLTAAAAGLLGQTLIRAGRPEEAIPLLQRTIGVLARSPEIGAAGLVGVTRTSLAAAFTRLRRHADAAAEFGLAVRDLRASHGDRHANTIIARAGLAGALARTGAVDAAWREIEGAEAAALEAHGREHVVTARVGLVAGEVLVARGEPARAAARVADALRVLEPALGPEAPDVRRGREVLAGARRAAAP